MTHFIVKRIGDCFYEMVAHEKAEAPAPERFRATVANGPPRTGRPAHSSELAALVGAGPTPAEAFKALAARISDRPPEECP